MYSIPLYKWLYLQNFDGSMIESESNPSTDKVTTMTEAVNIQEDWRTRRSRTNRPLSLHFIIRILNMIIQY